MGFASMNQEEPTRIKNLKECYMFYLEGFKAQG